MRVITGAAKGKKLFMPEGLDIRPTSDRVKEAVFSMIQFDLEGRRILDLFAGSGQMGIEALSRGAKHAVFTDFSAKSIETVKKNLNITGFSSIANVVQTDFKSFLNNTPDRFDVAFLDPPYRHSVLPDALDLLHSKMADGGIIVCESEILNEELPDYAGMFKKEKTAKYGKVYVTLYRWEVA